MKARIALVLAGAVVLSVLVFTATAFALSATKVTIKGPDGDFHGKIFSSNTHCLGGRVVRVFMSTDNGSTWQRIGSDTSSRNGSYGTWSIGNSGYRDGLFYARATRTTSCRGGKSPTIELVNGVPQ
jgi:hypothetical protein